MNPNIKTQFLAILRQIVILSRLNILLTVFSNCLAGWLLSGGGNCLEFIQMVFALMFLSSSVSVILVVFDETNSPVLDVEKKITEKESIILGFWMVGVAVFIAFLLDKLVGAMAIVVVMTALFMGVTRKKYLLSSLIPGFWRLFYYLAGGAVAANGLSGASMWGGVAIMLFMFGACMVSDSKWENIRSLPLTIVLFLCPLVLAVLINDGEPRHRFQVACFCLLALIWLYYNLKEEFKDNAITHRLAATICLFDLIAAGQESVGIAIAFLILFAMVYILGKLKFANFNLPLV